LIPTLRRARGRALASHQDLPCFATPLGPAAAAGGPGPPCNFRGIYRNSKARERGGASGIRPSFAGIGGTARGRAPSEGRAGGLDKAPGRELADSRPVRLE